METMITKKQTNKIRSYISNAYMEVLSVLALYDFVQKIYMYKMYY